ncbi:MAG: hypothetical protein E4G99_02215 [Anaerolineales bacterium]|nr:MAG: hypothetical protein E4G99_02215 [Anaerolineales bacterium]
MPESEATLQYVANMLSELEHYLLSPEIFWPLSQRNSATPQDRLTLGNLLLSLDQLDALRQTWDAQKESQFLEIEMQWEQSQAKWKSAIERKAEHEISSRMNLWRAYLEDLEEGQGAMFDYGRELRNRVMIERLFTLGVAREPWEAELQRLDRLLQSLVIPSEYIWPQSTQYHYPQVPYWFLYSRPRS